MKLPSGIIPVEIFKLYWKLTSLAKSRRGLSVCFSWRLEVDSLEINPKSHQRAFLTVKLRTTREVFYIQGPPVSYRVSYRPRLADSCSGSHPPSLSAWALPSSLWPSELGCNKVWVAKWLTGDGNAARCLNISIVTIILACLFDEHLNLKALHQNTGSGGKHLLLYFHGEKTFKDVATKMHFKGNSV